MLAGIDSDAPCVVDARTLKWMNAVHSAHRYVDRVRVRRDEYPVFEVLICTKNEVTGGVKDEVTWGLYPFERGLTSRTCAGTCRTRRSGNDILMEIQLDRDAVPRDISVLIEASIVAR